ncbi:hypothetical protein [Streptomyces sp. NPDC014894]
MSPAESEVSGNPKCGPAEAADVGETTGEHLSEHDRPDHQHLTTPP